jgi:glycosyltransferase involved in cell wall biosynthesis
VSESTFREIERFSGKNRGVMERISIIPNAVSLPKISPPSDRVKERRVDFGSPYLFSIISTDKPHKGIGDLLHVFEYVAQQLPDVRLIIVGRGTPSRDRVPDSLRERVELLGEIESDFLWRLYRCATFVVIPSIKEGFCLPLIEAHAVGVPVVARPIPAILEIATSDDFIADDMSRESFLSAILSALSSKNEGSQRLMDHASNFSVSRITEQTISVYKEAVR